MTLLTIALGWCLAAIASAWLWYRVARARPRTAPSRVQPRIAKCQCDVCTGKTQIGHLALSPAQIIDVQSGVLLVGTGASRVATLGVDYLNESGPGQLIIVTVDAPMWEQVVGPAIRAHLQSTRSGA